MTLEEYIYQIHSKDFRNLPELIYIPSYLFRCATAGAINSLADKFDLPNSRGMQDWEWEVADPTRIDEFIDAYLNGNLNDDERFTIAETIIQSFHDSGKELKESKKWEAFLTIIETNRSLHIHTIHYWASDDVQEQDDFLHCCFRVLWEKYKHEFLDPEKDQQIVEYKASLNYHFIKEQLQSQLSLVSRISVRNINHFNPEGYLAWHNKEELKENFIQELNLYQAIQYKSNIWNWGRQRFNIQEDYFYDEREKVFKKIEEELGIPQSVLVLLEEIHNNIRKLASEEEANKTLIELCESISLGTDLSLVTPKYQHWLLSEFVLPGLMDINDPLINEIRQHIELTSTFLLSYIDNKFSTIENIQHVVKYLRDWCSSVSDKKNGYEIDSDTIDINGIIGSTTGVLNNICIFLYYGADAATWATDIYRYRKESNELDKWYLIINRIKELLIG